MKYDVYKNKKILITGLSGFKGSWLNLWLTSLGAEVLGYSLNPPTNPSLYSSLNFNNNIEGNILDKEKLEKVILDFKPEFVFHLAAQPLVRLSYSNPIETYETNVIGTLNVLEAARKCNTVKAFVNITTDKCYENREEHHAYTENEPMGGYDMYSSSKGCVEIMSASYRNSFLQNGYALATARAGNVIGGGDWAEDRLVPDCIKAINENETIELRNPNAIRPWQHVLEPLSGYLLLGEKLYNYGNKFAQGFNFGPKEAVTVEEVVKNVIKSYGKGEYTINKKDDLHEANLLMLNIEKSKEVLGWQPQYDTKTAIEKTVDWYKRYYNGENMQEFSLKQIKDYNEIYATAN